MPRPTALSCYPINRQPRPSPLRQLELDILFFTDVGMDPFLDAGVFSISPRPVCDLGHPVTTGSPCMDYFYFQQRLELPDAINITPKNWSNWTNWQCSIDAEFLGD